MYKLDELKLKMSTNLKPKCISIKPELFFSQTIAFFARSYLKLSMQYSLEYKELPHTPTLGI